MLNEITKEQNKTITSTIQINKIGFRAYTTQAKGVNGRSFQL